MKLKDLTGQTFGRLYVLKRAERPQHLSKGTFWECKCTCGNITAVIVSSLVSGGTQSCGCNRFGEKRDPDLVAKYKALYEEGFNCPQIAEMFEVSHNAVFQALKGKVKFRAKGNKGIERKKDIEKWRSQYLFGMSIKEIARREKMTPEGISYTLRKECGINVFGDYIKKLEATRQSQAETMFEVYRRGYSFKEVSDILGCSELWVNQLLHEFYESGLRSKEASCRLAHRKRNAETDNRRSVNLATDRHDLKPITHRTKDLRWGQDNYDINRREHIL